MADLLAAGKVFHRPDPPSWDVLSRSLVVFTLAGSAINVGVQLLNSLSFFDAKLGVYFAGLIWLVLRRHNPD